MSVGALAAAEDDVEELGLDALDGVSCSTYEQIWRIAAALTWRASLVSATS